MILDLVRQGLSVSAIARRTGQGTQLVDQRRPLRHQPLARPVQRLHVKLRLSLQRHEAHRRPRRRLGNRLGVAVVVLLRLHIRPDILWRHQTDLVPERLRAAADMVRPAAGFHRHHTGRQLREQRRDPVPRHPPTQHDLPARRHASDTAAGLAQVNPENRNFRHPRLLLLKRGNPIPGPPR
jgi:hypothetical protein